MPRSRRRRSPAGRRGDGTASAQRAPRAAREWGHGGVACPDPAGQVCGPGGRRPARAGLSRAQPRVPGLVRARARPAPHARVAVRAGGRGARLVVRRRVHLRRPLLAAAQHRPRPAAGGRGHGRAVDPGRGQHLGAAAAAGHRRPRPGRAGGGAQLLAGHRVDPLLAGFRRAVGAARRQPVAASGGARAGRGGRGVAGQLRHRGGQHRHRDPADRRPRPGPRPGRGRYRGRSRCRAGRVRAHPAAPAPGAVRDADAGPARDPARPADQGERQRTALGRPGPGFVPT